MWSGSSEVVSCNISFFLFIPIPNLLLLIALTIKLMPTQSQKILITNRYFALKIHDCPVSIIALAASLGYDNVTVENFSQDYMASNLVQATIQHNGIINLALKSYLIDFNISKINFISLMEVWNQKGCNAIFHQSPLIKFKASDLPQAARYKALDNFKWNLELAIPSGASDGWGQITSPDESIIQTLAESLESL